MGKWEGTGKYKNINKTLDVLGVVIISTIMILSLIYWIQAPDIVPIHWNAAGEADGFGSKNTFFIISFFVLALYFLFLFLSRYPDMYNFIVEINPRNKEAQYNLATTLVKTINIEIISFYLFILIEQFISFSSDIRDFSFNIFPLQIVIIFGTIIAFSYKSIKLK